MKAAGNPWGGEDRAECGGPCAVTRDLEVRMGARRIKVFCLERGGSCLGMREQWPGISNGLEFRASPKGMGVDCGKLGKGQSSARVTAGYCLANGDRMSGSDLAKRISLLARKW